MNYETNDTYGIYRAPHHTDSGPGPTLMGAGTLIGMMFPIFKMKILEASKR